MRHFSRAPRVWFATTCAVVVGFASDVRAEPAGVDPVTWPVQVSGSRLVPVFLAGEDQSRQFVGWFDRVRGETCSFRRSGDGAIRCLPTEFVDASFFADPFCRNRIAVVPYRAAPRYLVEDETSACERDDVRHFYELGRRLRPTVVYARASGSCARAPIIAAAMYVAVGAEVPPASFVEAHYEIGRPGLTLKTDYDGPMDAKTNDHSPTR